MYFFSATVSRSATTTCALRSPSLGMSSPVDQVRNPRVNPSSAIGFVTNQTLLRIIACQRRSGAAHPYDLPLPEWAKRLRCLNPERREVDRSEEHTSELK